MSKTTSFANSDLIAQRLTDFSPRTHPRSPHTDPSGRPAHLSSLTAPRCAGSMPMDPAGRRWEGDTGRPGLRYPGPARGLLAPLREATPTSGSAPLLLALVTRAGRRKGGGAPKRVGGLWRASCTPHQHPKQRRRRKKLCLVFY